MQGGDAIDRMAADDGEVRHAHHLHGAFFDEGEVLLDLGVARPLGLDLLEKALVDLKDELEMTGHDLLEKSHAPLLERFGQQGVIGVGEGARDNGPGLVPRHAVFVMEQALQLDDGDGGMGVVELDGDLVREVFPVLVVLRKRRMISLSEQATKKYCWSRRSSLPLSVLSLG